MAKGKRGPRPADSERDVKPENDTGEKEPRKTKAEGKAEQAAKPTFQETGKKAADGAKIVARRWPVRLTAEQALTAGDRLATSLQELEKLEGDKAAAMSAANTALKDKRKEAKALRDAFTTRTSEEMVSFVERPDFAAREMRYYQIGPDGEAPAHTPELSRALRPDEYQRPLVMEGGSTEALADPSVAAVGRNGSTAHASA